MVAPHLAEPYHSGLHPNFDVNSDMLGFYWTPSQETRRFHQPKMDCVLLENRMLCSVEIPSSKPSEVKLTLKDDTLQILAPIHRHMHPHFQSSQNFLTERKSGFWLRTVNVPHGMTVEEVKNVTMKNGVLWMEMPRVTRETQRKKIEVEWVD